MRACLMHAILEFAPDRRASARLASSRGSCRDRLCLCNFHYKAIETGLAGCWAGPPFDVVWRLGQDELATWYRNERQLRRAEVKQWFRDKGISPGKK